MDPPVVPADRLDDWRRVADTTDHPFDAGPVSVTARTVRYERSGGPGLRPFCFASRLAIRPHTAPNRALTHLVERQALAGFRDRLADRGIDGIEQRGDREMAVDDPDASRVRLRTLHGECRLDPDGTSVEDGGVGAGASVPVEALLAVWTSGEYLLAGGAYPLSADAYPGERGATDARRELLAFVRGVRPPASGDAPE